MSPSAPCLAWVQLQTISEPARGFEHFSAAPASMFNNECTGEKMTFQFLFAGQVSFSPVDKRVEGFHLAGEEVTQRSGLPREPGQK